MASALHLLYPPASLQRKVTDATCVSPSSPLWCRRKCCSELFAKPALVRFRAKDLRKLRYASNGVLGVDSMRRCDLFNTSDNTDNMDDLVRDLQELLDEVKSMIKIGNKDDAIHLLKANYVAVKEQIDAGFKGIEQAAILDILALGYMGVGDFKLMEHLLDMLDEIVGEQDDGKPLVDSILMHMGGMYAKLDKFEDAMHVYGRGLDILQREFGNNSPFLITPLMGMAKIFGSTGRANKSISTYQRAIDILEKNRGSKSEELVIPLLGLGNLFISEGKATEAETCFSRILCIYTNIYGESDGRVGIAMCSLAHAMCAKGCVEEAILTYKRGLRVIKDSRYIAPDDDILEKMRIDLAELLHVTGREQEGRELLEECLLITESCRKIEHPRSVTHLLNLATSYSRSKNFVEAERLLRTCLHLTSKTVDPEDQLTTVPMLHLAVALYNLEQYEEAERLALEVVRIREDAFGKESLPVGEALDCLVPIQMRLGKDAGDILANLRRILSIQEKEMGYENEEVMETLKKLSFYLDSVGKKDEKLLLQRRLSFLRTKYKQKVTL